MCLRGFADERYLIQRKLLLRYYLLLVKLTPNSDIPQKLAPPLIISTTERVRVWIVSFVMDEETPFAIVGHWRG